MGKGRGKQRFKKTKPQPLMRVSKAERKEYADLRKKVMSKANRIKRNYGIDVMNETDLHLFKTTDPSEMTRKLYNKVKEKAESFTNRANTNYQYRKNKNNVVLTVKEINAIKRNIKQDQKNAEKRRKEEEKKNPTLKRQNQFLKKPKNEFGVMGNFNFDAIRSRKMFEERLKKSEERIQPNYYNERLLQMRENYIEKLYDVFNSDADPIVMQIMEMDLNDFYELYKRESRMQFDWVYINEKMEGVAEDYAEEISYYIERYKEGYYEDGLKDFPDTW